MLRLILATVVVAAGLGLSYQHWRAHDRQKKITFCHQQVDSFHTLYMQDRPVSETGPSDLRTVKPRAEQACNEQRFADAERMIRGAVTMCKLNNGCGWSRYKESVRVTN